MKSLLTNLALCIALPFSLDSATALPSGPLEVGPPSPDFSVIEPEHAREYIQKIYPYAVRVQAQQGVPVAITLAIACLETGYGRSHYAQTRHNHFGIRAYHHGKADYRHFSDLTACFQFYAGLFELERYAPLRAVPFGDLPAFVQGLQDCGFNHRDSYRSQLLELVEFLQLEKLTAPLA